MRTFLTIATWSYKRPTLLKKQQESLAMQTCQDFKQTVTEDEVGIGFPAVYEAFAKTECEGEYFWAFDSDDIITDPEFIAKVQAVADIRKPDVIICASQHTPILVLPDRWPLQFGHVSNINYIVRRDVWYKHRAACASGGPGDWAFLESVLKDNPTIARMEGVMLATQRVSNGRTEAQSEEHEKIGEWVRIEETCGGVGGMYYKGKEIQITEENRKNIAELIRCGRAVFKDRAPVKEQTKAVLERVRTLIFCATARLEQETVEALVNQEGVEFCDTFFTYDNPWKRDTKGNVLQNIRIAYEKMRRFVLFEGYQKVWIVESDTIVPRDALKKLLEVEADVVSGLYVFRNGAHAPNLFAPTIGDDFGPPITWKEIGERWGQTIDISGGAQGCLLVDRKTLEGFSFENDAMAHGADLEFMGHCQKNHFTQKARLDVICGHVNSNGEVYWPDKDRGFITKLKINDARFFFERLLVERRMKLFNA